MPLSTIAEAQARATTTINRTRRSEFLTRLSHKLMMLCIISLIILLLASFIGCIVSIMRQGHYRWMGILLIVHICVVVVYGVLSYFAQDMVGSPPRVPVVEKEEGRDEVSEGRALEEEAR
ncbi:hypothetical protein E2P81_ATG11146 [Venturia nashicola]|nr:hypothetical protein E2P81_ATG11146 [Venturia nashicola]